MAFLIFLATSTRASLIAADLAVLSFYQVLLLAISTSACSWVGSIPVRTYQGYSDLEIYGLGNYDIFI
ncbi:uncharacterized protein METZ01_LOCUS294103 [marine metagenome]|uniref:Uncharacterized protein n=1 Tax=marine metagenome TaxID=408172 RepID=A0A382LWW9_9ZZZZ